MVSIKAELAGRNCKYADIAGKAGIPVATFYKRLKKNYFFLDEAERILDILGLELVVRKKV